MTRRKVKPSPLTPEELRAAVDSAMADLPTFTRDQQAMILRAAVALEDEGEARAEVILDLMEKLIEVTRE